MIDARDAPQLHQSLTSHLQQPGTDQSDSTLIHPAPMDIGLRVFHRLDCAAQRSATASPCLSGTYCNLFSAITQSRTSTLPSLSHFGLTEQGSVPALRFLAMQAAQMDSATISVWCASFCGWASMIDTRIPTPTFHPWPRVTTYMALRQPQLASHHFSSFVSVTLNARLLSDSVLALCLPRLGACQTALVAATVSSHGKI